MFSIYLFEVYVVRQKEEKELFFIFSLKLLSAFVIRSSRITIQKKQSEENKKKVKDRMRRFQVLVSREEMNLHRVENH